MQAYAKLNKLPISPRKARLVIDLIRGKKVPHALYILKFEPKRASLYIRKLLQSAIANWKQKAKSDQMQGEDTLYIKKIYVNSAGILKRIKPAPQGRAHRIRKRLAHITLFVDSTDPSVLSTNKTSEQI